MKYIVLILVFIFIGCKAQQQILPLETKGWPVSGTYYKDLNNELGPYVGTWEGVYDNKTFIITFFKIVDHDNFDNYYKDRIIGKYKMLSNNNELYSTYNLPDSKTKVISLGFVEATNNAKLRLMFNDLCIEGEIHISFLNPQKTEMKWKYFTYQTMITDSTGCAPYNEMPRGEFILTKQ